MVIAVDFDGTVVSHEYPKVGRDIGAVPVLRALIENGHKIILLTMRDHQIHMTPELATRDGEIKLTDHDCLQEAIDWFKERNIALWGINENPDQNWTNSRKVYANLYIDDTALGVPMISGHVDWRSVMILLHSKKLITREQVQNILADNEWIKQVISD